MIERQRPRRLHHADREIAAHVADARQLQERAQQEFLVSLQAGDDDFEQEIMLARDQVARDYFRHRQHRLLECRRLLVAMALGRLEKPLALNRYR